MVATIFPKQGRWRANRDQFSLVNLATNIPTSSHLFPSTTITELEIFSRNKVPDSKFNSSSLLISGTNSRSQPPKIFECPHCHQKFGHPRSIYRHRKACEGKYDFECKECGRCFHRLDSLKHHVQSRHSSHL